jgi:quercetin dioxygenase-like cupin family protein
MESKPSNQKKGRITMNLLTNFKKIRILSLLIAPALTTVAAFIAAPAGATPSCGVTTTNLLDPVPAAYFPNGLLKLFCASNQPDWLLLMRARGDSDLYVSQLTFAPGAQAGWHTHPGPSLVTVIEGTLTVYHDDCTSETFMAGQAFTDVGCGDVHNVVNETGAEAKTIAVQIVPHGTPRRIDEPNPGCAQPPPCPNSEKQ